MQLVDTKEVLKELDLDFVKYVILKYKDIPTDDTRYSMIYAYINVKTGDICYIGQTVNCNPVSNDRDIIHRNYGNYYCNSGRSVSKIDTVLKNYPNNYDFLPLLWCPVTFIDEVEQFFISFYHTYKDDPLCFNRKLACNLTTGGSGNYNVSKGAFDKMVATKRANNQYPEIAKKIVETRKKHNNYLEGAKKASETKKARGTGKIGGQKMIETKRKMGIIDSSVAKAVATKRLLGITKKASDKAVATKNKLGVFKKASEKAVATKRSNGYYDSVKCRERRKIHIVYDDGTIKEFINIKECSVYINVCYAITVSIITGKHPIGKRLAKKFKEAGIVKIKYADT